ncbi:hypothetical protein [Halobacterium bonnevillei]|uniref:Uncharacterized protein n=1 Tax=Halobacterium bonnevillei TaxID=2692200 RepID=A0A6B0SKH6_9EURY|nr:hypothetical protein [Halobacterium bonnevillei]MXR19380.1 hypothetical protein [Halobacterium bonnevillei]
MTGYYDLLLVLLPASLFGLSGTLYAAGLGLTLALTVGGLVATGLTAHGLFVNDPSSAAAEPTSRSSAALESAD